MNINEKSNLLGFFKLVHLFQNLWYGTSVSVLNSKVVFFSGSDLSERRFYCTAPPNLCL